MNRSLMQGFIRAKANQDHPLQTELSLILTDFAPNGNKQGIPLTEKENIIRTAQYMPIKINFTGEGYEGHTGAIPVGPITAAYMGEDNGREVILGDAIIWNEVYKDIAEHLKTAFAGGIGTSWEIYFESADKDENDVEWLQGCVFAGSCVVDVPAYGPNRTRILAIAEALNKVEQDMAVTDKDKSTSQTADEVMQNLGETQDLLFRLWEGVDSLFNELYEIQAEQATSDIGKIAETFAEKIAKIADFVKNQKSAAESVKAELDTLKQEKVDAELAQAKADRKSKLTELGIDFDKREDKYMAMSTEDFNEYVDDLSAVKKPATSEQKKNGVVPEPLTPTGVSQEELVSALKESFKR